VSLNHSEGNCVVIFTTLRQRSESSYILLAKYYYKFLVIDHMDPGFASVAYRIKLLNASAYKNL